jgi:3-phenylpropionate/trans-cinnamate dioxygenase ferredoxin reductase subunit
MASTCNLIVNGHAIKANIGETLVDAALGGWTVIPHDCCSGQCETCRVTVVAGNVDDQETGDGRTVLACTATINGDAEIEFDEVPRLAKRSGVIAEITTLAADVVEVVVTLDAPFDYRAGQYFNVKISGFPGRDLSPSVRADGASDPNELVFHIRRYPGGLVSTQIGTTIRIGRRVHVRGPFGQAFLREGDGPIILISGGTGWAPIWSVATEARRTQRHRDLFVVAGARDPASLYMRQSLNWLTDDGVRDVIATTQLGALRPILAGLPTHYLPSLGLEDTVYVAGPPGLVDAIRTKARAARARCYADPFLPGVQKLSMIDRMRQMLRRSDPTTRSIRPVAGPAYEPALAEDGLRQAILRRQAAVSGRSAVASQNEPSRKRR